ncbi:MAG: M28 family peptidase [Ignavibacteriaceae bacterium]|nr:M28 family peptidase [Ignavibacteriaceae bacterium]
MKRYLFTLLLPILFFINVYGQHKAPNPEITAKEIQHHIEFLASDDLKGRLSGSKEIYIAAVYIKDEFESYHLQPLFKDSYFQEYNFISDVKLTDNNSLKFDINGKDEKLDLFKDYIPTTFSGKNSIKAGLIFAGYGISAPKLNYDDYANVDVKGKIVIVMRSTPEYDKPRSEFDKFASLRFKAALAKEKGAAGIIFVNGHLPKDSSDNLVKFTYERAAGEKDFPIVQVKRSFVDQLFKSQNLDFAEYQLKMKESRKPASFIIKNSNADISTEVEALNSVDRNVAGYLEGTDSVLKNEYIVIGAHYDHLGMGIEGSLYKGTEPKIHHGADDNASGTAGVMELAEKFASVRDMLKRSIIFITFSGEELGLIGSNYFVNHLPIPADKIDAMINLDMVGRLRDDALTVYGTGTSSKWKDILNRENKYHFKLAFNDEGFGPSDQSSFYGKGIPVLFFFTGVHEDYHRPSDVASLINSAGEDTVLHYVYDVAGIIDSMAGKPNYIKIASKGTSGDWKVYAGTIPDMSNTSEGFKLSGVSPGGPAEKAGLKGGDVMLKFGDKEINNIYDYVYSLQDHVPGDVVVVVVKRGDQKLSLTLTLGAK